MKELNALIEISKISGNGSNALKQNILKQNKTPDMEWLLQIALNPFKTTKVSKLKLKKSKDSTFDDVKSIVEYLLTVKAAKDEDREKLEESIAGLNISEDEKDMLVKIVTKNLNIGLGPALINKIYGKNFIPDLELMAAQDDLSVLDLNKTHYAEIKYDGVRVIAVESNHGIEFYTRNFNLLNSSLLPSLEKEVQILISKIKDKYPNKRVFVDGELTDSNRKSVTGKVNQILKGKETKPIDNDLIFNIFDFGDFSIIENDLIGDKTYKERRDLLDQVFDDSFSKLKKAEMYVVNSKSEINELFNSVVAKGGEGLIIKTASHKYECKRSKSWIKLKEINDCDLEITGWFEGENKRKDNGWIGGFNCASKDKQLSVSVGSGFTEDMLNYYSKDPDSFVGKIAKIQYNTKIQDKHGNWSLFLPIFLEIRSDKTEADDLSRIS